MTQIIGFAGKKQSGKNSCCNFLTMLKLIENGVCKSAHLNNQGEIEVSDVFGESISGEDFFVFKNPIVNTEAVLNGMNTVRIYALADPLKRIAIDILGLPEDKVYGTDADKQELTHLMWEDMPGVITTVSEIELMGFFDAMDEYQCLPSNKNKPAGTFHKRIRKGMGDVVIHEPGPMTVREVLQYLGTDIFRKMYTNVWLKTCIRRIKNDKPEIALICDVRFDNEITGLINEGAIILGLTRDIFDSKDQHSSEQVNFSLCSKVIDNSSLDIAQQNEQVYKSLLELNCKNLTDLGV